MSPTPTTSFNWIGADIRKSPEIFAQDQRQIFPILDLNLKPWLPKDKSAALLDFGCGYGTLLSYVKKQGYANLTGFDPDPRCADFCKDLGIVHVEQLSDPLAFLEANQNKFDLITVTNVATYFPKNDLIEWYTALAKALRPQGRLIVEVINSSTMFGNLEHWNDPFKCTPYTDVLLRDLMIHSAFEILALDDLKIPKGSVKKRAWLFVRSAWTRILKFIYLLEHGAHERVPRLFGQRLFLVARKL